MGAKNRISIVRAVQELEVNAEEITTVKGWARHMGYSRSHFSRCIKKQFGRIPKIILADVRRERIVQAIKAKPNAIGYEIAVDTDFINHKALHKFLATYFDTTFIELRQEIL